MLYVYVSACVGRAGACRALEKVRVINSVKISRLLIVASVLGKDQLVLSVTRNTGENKFVL